MDGAKDFLNAIIEVGTVSSAAKAAISAIKAIPGLNIAASILNAVIAGSIVISLGEASIYIFEQIYLGNKSIADVDWMKKIIEGKFSTDFISKVKSVLDKISDNTDKKAIMKILVEIFGSSVKKAG